MKILIAGEGGQGVQLIAEVLAKTAFSEGKKSLYIPNFGVEQRGGVSLAFITIDNYGVVYPKFEIADYLIVFCDRALERVKNYIGRGTKIILGPAVESQNLMGGNQETIIIKKNWFPSRVWNILALGKLNSLANIVSFNSLKNVLFEKLLSKFKNNKNLEELNEKALFYYA